REAGLLLPNLHEPSLIIMDNASYHKTLPPTAPDVAKLKKQEVIAALYQYQIPHDATSTVAQLKVLLKNWIKEKVLPEVIEAAERAGHRVLFTPPHYSDLQPMELVWAYVKGNIARQYTKNTTLEDVKQRLDAEFIKLEQPSGRDLVKRIIVSRDRVVEDFRRESSIEDGVDSDDDGGDDDDDLFEEDFDVDELEKQLEAVLTSSDGQS
ncbi:Hypothetical Protein FCC1311_041772, partial [Hondaea fermentalgiana]